MLNAGSTYTTYMSNASASGGTAPYTFSRSGVLNSNGDSVTGSPASSGSLYLDVWDAAGRHVAVSTYVTVCDNAQISC
jgi:hypothetical protein